MDVLMAIEPRRRPAVQAGEFSNLGRKYLAKRLSQKWIVDEERVLVCTEKTTEPLVTAA
jgi:hypothetical protein